MMATETLSRTGAALFQGLTNHTDAEKCLWKRLRHHQLGVLFRRRKVPGSDRVDFYCPEAALVVVIDDTEEEAAERQAQDARLRRFGLETLRFGQSEILGNLDRVIVEIFRVALGRTATGNLPR